MRDRAKLIALLVWLQAACSSSPDASPGTVVPDASTEADASEGDSEPPADASDGADDLDDAIPACDACMLSRCWRELDACRDNPACEAYDACLRECTEGDDACVAACQVAHAEGVSAREVRTACYLHECNEACELGEELACGVQLADPVCDVCARQNCCDQLYANFHEPDHWAFITCADPCSDSDQECIKACVNEHALGYVLNQQMYSCFATKCNAECIPWYGLDPGTDACGAYVPDSAPCRPCVEQSCCDVFQQVSADDALWYYLACWYGCSDEDCANQCAGLYPEGHAAGYLAMACLSDACGAECPSQAFPSNECGMAFEAGACETCSTESCCEQRRYITFSEAFWLFESCLRGCSHDAPDACRAACMADYPDGWAAYAANWNCHALNCRMQCGYDWLSPTNPCTTCVFDQCYDSFTACAVDRDCERLEACRMASMCRDDDEACLDTCRALVPEAVSKFDEATACRVSHCGTQCAGP